MEVFIAKDGKKLGPYAEEVIVSMLTDGFLRPEDSFWKTGMSDWKPLSTAYPGVIPAQLLVPPNIQTPTYAGFWLRCAAMLLDLVIVVIGSFLIGLVLGLFLAISSISTEGMDGVFQIIGIVICWLYFALMESSPLQATVGKRICGIKVTDMQGSPVSFGRATGRHFSKILSYLIILMGFFMTGWTTKKQALHDMIAGCLVVRK